MQLPFHSDVKLLCKQAPSLFGSSHAEPKLHHSETSSLTIDRLHTCRDAHRRCSLKVGELQLAAQRAHSTAPPVTGSTVPPSEDNNASDRPWFEKCLVSSGDAPFFFFTRSPCCPARGSWRFLNLEWRGQHSADKGRAERAAVQLEASRMRHHFIISRRMCKGLRKARARVISRTPRALFA